MSSSCSTSRIARCGTSSRSPTAARCSSGPSRCGAAGPYVLQAAIADLHVHEPRDWEQIALLYATLSRLTGSPVVELNRAIAVAEIEGPEAALEILDSLDLDDYRYLHSTRADLLRRLGRDGDARLAYARALELTDEGPEQRFLAMRLAELPAPSERDE